MDNLEQYVREIAINSLEGDKSLTKLCEAITKHMHEMQAQILKTQEQVLALATQVKTLAEYTSTNKRTH